MNGNFTDVISYKKTLVNHLISANEITELLLTQLNPNLTTEEQLQNQVLDFDFTPEAEDPETVYLCVDADITRVPSRTIKEMEITIHIFTVKSLMEYVLPEGPANRIDLLSDRIDSCLVRENFGIRMNLKSSNITKPFAGYYGRKIIYTISQFKRGYE
ncbi:hypothetical protein [Sinanaerobacter chloroacetimidivorans]|uniref:Uncharacterized protein n=1 Tax=Sinanaerobacter chloroacetimidivorans TaxID=2818044 RepID=A0A8J7W0G1_9FIRM|nr:hypothetical protein [Sinanaerobacter chloroacetimidivorans]MBR0596958.1 hypothetical protein [Sinanaerobacter chloroacetimidivorans]